MSAPFHRRQRLEPAREPRSLVESTWFWVVMAVFLALASMLMTGCTTKARPIHYTAPSAAPVSRSVEKASAEVKQTRVGISKARENVQAAADDVRVIIGELPDNLKPRVEGLELRLNMALRDLQEADARAELAEGSLNMAETHIGELQTEILKQTADLETTSGLLRERDIELSKTKAALSVETGLKWWWRFYCFGIVALVAGFFVLRQHIPFLKLI